MHFFTSTQSPKNRLYLDARKITTLTFWVKRTTNATIILRLADAKRHRKGKALRLGRLSSFLQKPSKKGKWQRVIVPLRRFKKRIALKQLAAFVFEIVTPGKGRLQIKTFSFCRVPKRLPKLPPITPSNKKKKDFVKASWLWNTKQILRSKHKQSVMLRFLRSQGINRLFIQLPQKITSTPSLKDFAPYRKRLRKLLKKLNLAKIQTYAMIGRPEYALQKWHKRLFQLTQAIGKFNKKGRKKERFTGLHLDIEAYRISGFWGVRKKSIINQYLHLLKRLKIKTQKLSLRLSLDLPFWFDSPNLIKNQKHSDISKTLSEKLIDLADDINIMDYRTRLYGPNGLLILVQDELKYASQKGKPILIALETHEVANEHLLLFHGKAKRGFPKLSRTKKTKQKFYLFATQKAGKAQGTFWFVPRHRLKEWRIYASQKLRSRKKIWYWPIRRNIFLPANQISFAFSSHSFLKKRMRQLKEELQRYQAFAGFGIHHVGSYRKLFQNR